MMTSSERFQIASQEFARFHEHVSHHIKSDMRELDFQWRILEAHPDK